MDDTLPSSICLLSTASLGDFPYNTRTHFINQLPSAIRTQEADKHLYIRLRAIAISCLQDREMLLDPNSDYLKVNVSELEQQIVDRGYDHCAGGFEYPPRSDLARNTNYAFHIFSRTPYLRLRFGEITRLEVTITNSIGRVVDGIYSGPPTIILFDVTRNMRDENFTITCNSNHPDLFVNNSLTSFTSPLHTEMDLSNYQVALVNVLYPPTMYEQALATMFIDDVQFNYVLDDFTHTEDFILQVQQDLAASKFAEMLEFKIYNYGWRAGRWGLGRKWGRRFNRGYKKKMIVRFSNTFTLAMGQRHDFRGTTILTPGKAIIFKGQPNINLAKSNPIAALHCDIVKSGVIGNKVSNLLSCVPVMTDRTMGRRRLYEAAQLIFYDVVSRPINSLTFLFTNPDGGNRSFKTQEEAVHENISITLTFRKKPMRHVKQVQ